MIEPFKNLEFCEEQWPVFEPITKENATLRFRQFNQFSEYIKLVGYNYMKGNDIKRFDRAPEGSFYYNEEPGKLEFKLTPDGVYFTWSWATYFRNEYDDGDTWEFLLSYDVFTLEESEILALGAKQKEQQIFKEKKESEARMKKEKEEQEKRDLEYRKQLYEELKKEFKK